MLRCANPRYGRQAHLATVVLHPRRRRRRKGRRVAPRARAPRLQPRLARSVPAAGGGGAARGAAGALLVARRRVILVLGV